MRGEANEHAELEQIYLAVQSARPTGNVHWKAKIRQTLLRHPQRFARAGQGRYRLCADAGPDHPRRELVAS